jgi:hypothetical protein
MTQLPAAWFRIFVVILLKVNWKPGTWWNGSANVSIPAGSMVTSVEKLSKMARASTKQTRGVLAYLQTANIAAIKTTSHYTLITVLNWATYQNADADEGKPHGNAEGEQRASQGQTEGKAGATIEEGNQGNKESGKKEKHDQDSSPVSRKNGVKPRSASSVRSSLGSEPSHYVTGKTAREALREHLHAWGINPVPPDDDILESIMEAGVRYGATVDEITLALDDKIIYASSERERTRPRDYEWFITVVANEFRTRLDRKETPSSPNTNQARIAVRTAISARWKHLGETPEEKLNEILDTLANMDLKPYLNRLANMSEYFVSGKGKALGFDFFVKEARSYRNECAGNARINGLAKYSCRHGLADGECVQCLPRAEQLQMTDAF